MPTPFARREQAIIDDRTISLETKISRIIDNIVRAVREVPRRDVAPLPHAMILFGFALDMLRFAGVPIDRELTESLKAIAAQTFTDSFATIPRR